MSEKELSANKSSEKIITKDTVIGEIAMKYPRAVQVLSENGFHCIGCPASQMESVEDGARAHGMDDKGVAELVAKLDRAAMEDKKELEGKKQDHEHHPGCCGG